MLMDSLAPAITQNLGLIRGLENHGLPQNFPGWLVVAKSPHSLYHIDSNPKSVRMADVLQLLQFVWNTVVAYYR